MVSEATHTKLLEEFEEWKTKVQKDFDNQKLEFDTEKQAQDAIITGLRVALDSQQKDQQQQQEKQKEEQQQQMKAMREELTENLDRKFEDSKSNPATPARGHDVFSMTGEEKVEDKMDIRGFDYKNNLKPGQWDGKPESFHG